MNHLFPRDTRTILWLDKLIRPEESRPLPARMSTRMVKCASALPEGARLGWQMSVPRRGMTKLLVFGSQALTRGDLLWITEKTAVPARRSRSLPAADHLTGLYELRLPMAEKTLPAIGFGAESGSREKEASRWPSHFMGQFGELLRALRETGAELRVTLGSASPEAQRACRAHALKTYSLTNLSPDDYIGRPVRFRALLRLPQAPSVRLRTVLAEAVPGVRLRPLGEMTEPETAAIWDDPLRDAPVLPDFAARFLLLEPILTEPVVGVELCEAAAEKLPAGHKNPKDPRAVTIGEALDAAGGRRRVTVGELDLRRHYQIVGQTGTGKSTLLVNLMLSAIRQGHGLTFFDPHGTTIDTLLRCIPPEQAHRVRVVRIGDAEHPVPLNIWDSGDPELEERNISDLCELFADIFNPPGEVFVGPRYERWLSTFAKASLAFLGRRASLESIAVISQSQDNMLKVSKAIYHRYPRLVDTIREEYGLDNSSDFHSTLSWYLCKFQRLTSVEQLRKTLGAGVNALDFPRSVDSDTVTLIDLASPAIGTQPARIVGTILLMKLWNAVCARERRDLTHLVVVDEASLFQTNPMPRMLAEGRKFGIGMVLCHQHEGQLSREIRDALEANSANFSAFRLSTRDAADAAIRFDDPEMRARLARLSAFQAVTTLSVAGQQTAPFTLEIRRPRLRKDGETIAGAIERRSIQTLVTPYRHLRALTPDEIRDCLDDPKKRAALDLPPEPEPEIPQLDEYLDLPEPGEYFFTQEEEDEDMPPELCEPIEALDLTVRSFNCLKRAGISTIDQLLERMDTVDEIRNFGSRSQKEVAEKLQAYLKAVEEKYTAA